MLSVICFFTKLACKRKCDLHDLEFEYVCKILQALRFKILSTLYAVGIYFYTSTSLSDHRSRAKYKIWAFTHDQMFKIPGAKK